MYKLLLLLQESSVILMLEHAYLWIRITDKPIDPKREKEMTFTPIVAEKRIQDRALNRVVELLNENSAQKVRYSIH